MGPLHHNTLLDGEMVVDENLETGGRERRFLVYDVMMVDGASIVDKPFKVGRFHPSSAHPGCCRPIWRLPPELREYIWRTATPALPSIFVCLRR